MNKLVNNIFRRNSVAVTGVSNPAFDFANLSKVDYKTSVHLLNKLQTNEARRASEKGRSKNDPGFLHKTKYYLSLIGIEPESLNQLRVIHVGGTNGKGSTCAFVESILRQSGFKTGHFSSPHLVMTRERIRINGEPISEQKFAQYFSHVYNQIRDKKLPDTPMPTYSSFIAVMAFHIFLQEKVYVAVIEVADIGGEDDCTNVVPKPVVTGVTSIDLDHTKFAWEIAGIFKDKVPVFTVKQNEKSMQALTQRANEKNAPLYAVPSWSIYPQSLSTKLGINGNAQKLNASLAVQLAHYWIGKQNQPKYVIPTLLTNEGNFADVISLSANKYSTALAQTKLLGRCERLSKNEVNYFLDAAQTSESVQNSAAWFKHESYASKSTTVQQVPQSKGSIFKSRSKSFMESPDRMKAFRILVFNCPEESNASLLLAKLGEIAFDLAIFTTNTVGEANPNMTNLTASAREKEICSNNSQAWNKLSLKVESIKVFSITETIEAIEKCARKVEGIPVHVLVTGSVQLVGAFVGLIHPNYQSGDGFIKM